MASKPQSEPAAAKPYGESSYDGYSSNEPKDGVSTGSLEALMLRGESTWLITDYTCTIDFGILGEGSIHPRTPHICAAAGRSMAMCPMADLRERLSEQFQDLSGMSRYAATAGRLKFLEMMVRAGFAIDADVADYASDPAVLAFLAEHGYAPTEGRARQKAEVFASAFDARLPEVALDPAIKHIVQDGDLAALKEYARGRAEMGWTRLDAAAALLAGKTDMFRWMIAAGCAMPPEDWVSITRARNLGFLKWMVGAGYCLDREIVMYAAPDVDVVRWLMSVGYKWTDDPARIGHDEPWRQDADFMAFAMFEAMVVDMDTYDPDVERYAAKGMIDHLALALAAGRLDVHEVGLYCVAAENRQPAVFDFLVKHGGAVPDWIEDQLAAAQPATEAKPAAEADSE